jgi:hypothetical protein
MSSIIGSKSRVTPPSMSVAPAKYAEKDHEDAENQPERSGMRNHHVRMFVVFEETVNHEAYVEGHAEQDK